MRMNFATKLLLIALACLIVAFCISPVQIANYDALLTAATFLFSVLYGFEISIVISNFSQLKTQLAVENAGLLTIFHLADIIGDKAGREIKDNVEKYLLTAIDRPLENHLVGTDQDFFKIFEPVKKLSAVKGDQKGQALQYLNEAIYYVPQARNQVAEFAPRFVDKSVWLMLSVLAGILVAILLIGHGVGSIGVVASAIFSTTVIGALILLDEIDSNRIQEAHLEYGIFNETLVQIGRETYYPDFALRTGIVKIDRKGKTRIGHFPKYPSLAERTIEERRPQPKKSPA
jgi:hypothetical protein